MLQIQLAGETTVIRVLGDLDLFSAPSLAAALVQSESFTGNIVVSLEECTYCDAAGLSVLVGAYRRVDARLRVVLPVLRGARRAFEVTGLCRSLPVAESDYEASLPVPNVRFTQRRRFRFHGGRYVLARLHTKA